MSFNDDDAVFVTADKISEKDEKVESYDVEIVSDEELIEKTDDNVPETAIAPVTENDSALADYEILNPEIPISEKISITVKVADTLKTIVKHQGLVKKGLNKKKPEEEYVLKGGWEMLNTFMGITPVTKVIDEIRNDKGRIVGYKGQCTLLKDPEYVNGEIVGGKVMSYAEASATREGFQKDTSSMMSMAQTRAYNKATRNCMGWIMQMAGFQGTPAEEMPSFKDD